MCHYCFLRSVFLIKLGDHLALVHHVNSVADAENFRHFGGNEQNGLSLLDELVDDAIDLVLRADIDTAGRFVQYEYSGSANIHLARTFAGCLRRGSRYSA